MAVGGVSGYSYNDYTYGSGLSSSSWVDNANKEADKLKESLGIKDTDKTESTSSTSSTNKTNTATTASSTSSFLMGYQMALEDLESASGKLQAYSKDNVFSKLETVLNKQAKGEATDEDVSKAMDNVVDAAKDFADKYNYTVSYLKKNIEQGSGISNQLEAFQRSIPNEKTLKAVGMSVDKNGNLQVDEDKMKEALQKDPSQVKELIGGQFSMADRVGSKATSILDSSIDKILGKEASDSSDTEKTNSSSSSSSSSAFGTSKNSMMSDSFLQFASFAKSGAYNLSNYYAVSMLNILV